MDRNGKKVLEIMIGNKTLAAKINVLETEINVLENEIQELRTMNNRLYAENWALINQNIDLEKALCPNRQLCAKLGIVAATFINSYSKGGGND